MNISHLNQLAQLLTKIQQEDNALAFLKNILTPSELEEVASRLQIFKLLQSGMPQREVAAALNVSIGTVSRGARELKYGENGIKQIFVDHPELATTDTNF